MDTHEADILNIQGFDSRTSILKTQYLALGVCSVHGGHLTLGSYFMIFILGGLVFKVRVLVNSISGSRCLVFKNSGSQCSGIWYSTVRVKPRFLRCSVLSVEWVLDA